MHVETLTIENFLTIGEAKLHLTDRGLVLIQGENADNTSANSNGAGKSSIADAISWAFFGTTARGESGDRVINRFVGKNCRVAAVVRDGDELYEIARHRKHKEGKNGLVVKQLAPAPSDLTKGTDKLTQLEVNRILGCSEEVFNSAVYAGQEKMPDLPAMTDKPLKLLIEEAAGITILEKAYEVARAKQAVTEREACDAQAQLDRIQARIDSTEDEVARLQGQQRAWDEKRAESVQSESETAKALADQVKALDADIATLDEPGVLAQLDEVESKLKEVVGEQEEKSRLERELAAADRRIAVVTAEIDRLTNDAKRRKAEVDAIDSRIGKPCGECGKSYEASDLTEARKIATGKLRKVVDEVKTKKAEANTLREARAGLAEGLSTFVAGMTDISAATGLQGRLCAKLRDIEAKKGERSRIADRTRQHIANAKRLKDEQNPFAALIEKAGRTIEELVEEIGTKQATLEAAQARLALAQSAVKVFGPAGVRAEILDTVTPFLNARTAHYLGSLSDGNITATWSTLSTTAKGELREKFAIDVTDATGAESFGGLSGGEKRKVRLACCLALQDLVASRATKPINLWIGDEIDTALDVAGLERLMGILEEKARERGTVLVISHNDLKDWCRQQVIVKKEGGRSSVDGVLCHA
ncbi:AAA family ATPase [Magnetospirillum molischianum]|uniref:Putative exonuclease n=1 Tax=Magnetospirillum molischianum DSM 120 TaxID=1150626 RepID=H8FYA9_MAGML|nr:AAA family ATPase [Magnetospirillum molischianum]CCG43347.1 putative exonuclease [Magnetospirillum molischianum DSM 120]